MSLTLLQRLAGGVLLAASLQAAQAQAPQAQASEIFLEDMTSPEVRDAVAAGTTTILIPIGGTEQNGSHMALGKHNVRVRALAARIAGAVGHALVAPTIAYVPEGSVDPPVAHMRFPGTITVPDAAFRVTLEYAARSFAKHGFRDIVLLGDHGGYQADLATVAAKLDREWAKTPVRVHALAAYYQASTAGFAAALRARGFKDAEIGTHAGLADTSLMLAVDPRLVRRDRLDPANGVAGDPRRASADLGEIGVNGIVTAAVAAIEADRHRPAP